MRVSPWNKISIVSTLTAFFAFIQARVDSSQ
jgi:hypothetical protein